MLGKRGIYAISPEVGTRDVMSNWFFIESPDLLQEILDTNFVWIEGIISRFFPRLEIEHLSSEVLDDKQVT